MLVLQITNNKFKGGEMMNKSPKDIFNSQKFQEELSQELGIPIKKKDSNKK
jgi:hypothetical protein